MFSRTVLPTTSSTPQFRSLQDTVGQYHKASAALRAIVESARYEELRSPQGSTKGNTPPIDRREFKDMATTAMRSLPL